MKRNAAGSKGSRLPELQHHQTFLAAGLALLNPPVSKCLTITAELQNAYHQWIYSVGNILTRNPWVFAIKIDGGSG